MAKDEAQIVVALIEQAESVKMSALRELRAGCDVKQWVRLSWEKLRRGPAQVMVQLVVPG
jgi:hypothetical protein